MYGIENDLVVTSTKIFKCAKNFNAETLVTKLKRAKKKFEVTSPETGDLVPLYTTIESVVKTENNKTVRGVLRYDIGVPNQQRDGKVKFVTNTISVPFSFLIGSLYFVPFAKGKFAEVVADRMGGLVMSDIRDPILTCSISARSIEDFLSRNNHVITRCWWRNLNIPRLSGSVLNGTGIDDTADFRRYDEHGEKGSVQFRLSSNGWSLLVNQHAGVVFYGSMTRDEMENFLRREIVPRCG